MRFDERVCSPRVPTLCEMGAVGYPGVVDGYQVNFRVSADAAKGAAAIQVTAAWLPGPPVKISIE